MYWPIQTDHNISGINTVRLWLLGHKKDLYIINICAFIHLASLSFQIGGDKSSTTSTLGSLWPKDSSEANMHHLYLFLFFLTEFTEVQSANSHSHQHTLFEHLLEFVGCSLDQVFRLRTGLNFFGPTTRTGSYTGCCKERKLCGVQMIYY